MECGSCGQAYPHQDGVLHLVSQPAGPPSYDPHYFAQLAEVERRHFWFVSRRQVILDALRRTVPDLGHRALFDVGCGSGGLLEFLGQSGVRIEGACDAYLQSLQIVRHRVSVPLVLVDEGRLPPLGGGRSLVSLFDVLEHLDDDVGTLEFLRSVLEPGGVLLLTVPAHPFLFDEMDRLAHHRRRYGRAELAAKLARAGFEVRVLTHFMAPLVPALMVLRALGRLWPRVRHDPARRRAAELRVVPGFNELMRAPMWLERRWLAAGLDLPLGLSLLAVASRPSRE